MSESLVSRYFCHMCDRMVNPVMDAEIKCPYCDQGFLEEMDSRDAMEDNDPNSDRSLSLWAPILLGMMGGGGSRRRRYHHRREEYDDESDQDHELDILLRRGRRNPAIIHLLQSLRAERSLESNVSSEHEEREGEGERDGNRDRDMNRSRDRESVILINPFNQAIIFQGSFDSDRNHNSDATPGTSLGDYFIGPGLEMLLQHLAENDPNRYGTPPAKKEAVEAMPTVKVDDCSSCPVCLENFVVGIEAKEMPCGHKFHAGCIMPWLELHSSCPVCRFQLPADESKASNPATDGESRSESTSGGGSDVGGGSGRGNGNRFWAPFHWPFNGLFSSSATQRNGSNSGSSSSSSPASGNDPGADGN